VLPTHLQWGLPTSWGVVFSIPAAIANGTRLAYMWRQMSIKLSFKEALARRDKAKASSRERSASPGVRVILRAGDIARPVDVARLLATHGMSLRKAHETLNRLAAGETVAVELQATSKAKLRGKFSELGIAARTINLPAANVKRIREHFGLSQAEFAFRFGFEIDTIQNWEQGRNRPDQATQLLLRVIEAYPENVEAVLTKDEAIAARPKPR
jgi:DNA-binding transcriptional regulator YiaG